MGVDVDLIMNDGSAIDEDYEEDDPEQINGLDTSSTWFGSWRRW